MATDEIPGRVEFAFSCLFTTICLKFFNNPLESTLVFLLLCYSWTSLCNFYSLKALALKHVPQLLTNDLHKFGFSDIYIYIYIYIYVMYFQVYT